MSSLRGKIALGAAVARRSVAPLTLAVAVALPGSAFGTDWSVQSTPTRGGSMFASLFGVSCTSPRACTAVGSTDDASLGSVPVAERWDGRHWTVQATPNRAYVYQAALSAVSCVSSSACVAVGTYGNDRFSGTAFAERWDGSQWSIDAVPNPAPASYLVGVSCTSPTACLAVGSFWDSATRLTRLLAERWDGRIWAIQEIPEPVGGSSAYLASVSCTSSTSCMAVGNLTDITGHASPLTARWDGSQWTLAVAAVPAGVPDGTFSGITCTSSTECIAVGFLTNVTGGSLPLAERWHAGAWTVLAISNPVGWQLSSLSSVWCTTAAACTAVGGPFISGRGPFAERFDGKRWSFEATDSTASDQSDTLAGISCTSSTHCVAVGSQTDAQGNAVALVERRSPAATRLTGIPKVCVRARFTARVTGEAIAGVKWSLDRRRVRGRTVHQGRSYAASVRTRPGDHRLTVTVSYDPASRSPTHRFHRRLVGCRSHRR